MMTVPIRTGTGPLHLSQATGHGYRTACGKTLAGANLNIPRPRIALTRGALVRYWAKCWELERVCRSCQRIAEIAHDDAEVARIGRW